MKRTFQPQSPAQEDARLSRAHEHEERAQGPLAPRPQGPQAPHPQTAGDNAIIVTALVARNFFRVPAVVARDYAPRRAQIYRRLGLQTVSTTAWGVARATQLLLHRELNVIRTIGEGELELLEQEVPGHWVGRSAGQVSVPGEIDVVAILRRGRAHLAAPASVFERGDRAVIAIVAGARTRLEHLLGLR